MTSVHLVVPEGIDDPERPSGGNTYDRRIRDGLAERGWAVVEHVSQLPDLAEGSVVLVDGLCASTAPEMLVRECRRLRVVVLMHMPVGGARERSVLAAAASIVTTSDWSRRWLLDRHGLPRSAVHVVEPGVDVATLAPGTATGGELLCVAAVIPGKGQDVLLEALASVSHRPWRLTCVGGLARAPAFVARLRRQADESGIGARVRFAGPQVGAALAAQYASADVLVLASLAETYGMVVTEALARGLPVVATTVGGLPEALGRGRDGSRPGLLVPPGDPRLLAEAVCRWLDDPLLRERLRETARERRCRLRGWDVTSARISDILLEVAP